MPTQSTLLSACIAAHHEAIERVEKLAQGMSNEQANWKPAPKKWSVAECLSHLNQGLTHYNNKLATVLDNARAANKTGTEPYGRGTFVGRYIVNFLKKGPGKKAPAPGVFKPERSGLKIEQVTQDFKANVRRLIELAENADGLKLGHIKFATPVSALIRVSAAQAFELHTHHTPRHLAQAEKLKQTEGYPG